MSITKPAQSPLDSGQTLKGAYDDDNSAFRVESINPFAGLTPSTFDYVAVTYPSPTQEVYTFKTGGSGGTTVATITVNYTDSTKNNLLDATRT